MISSYKILFSIKVCVQNSDGSNTLDSLRTSFHISPTASCRENLKHFGLLFKAVEGGGLVLQEYIGDSLTTPKREITDLTTFLFRLQLNDKSILNHIAPFVSNNGTETEPVPLSPFLGKARVFYFDNLDSLNVINSVPIDSDCQQEIRLDANGKPDRDGNGEFQYDKVSVIPLTKEADQVDIGDLSSTLPNHFVYIGNSSVTREVYSVHPSSSVIIRNPPDQTSQLPYYKVNDGAYRLIETVGATVTKEIIFASNELVNTDSIGIIQIFKNNSDLTNHEIKFQLV